MAAAAADLGQGALHVRAPTVFRGSFMLGLTPLDASSGWTDAERWLTAVIPKVVQDTSDPAGLESQG